MKTLKEQAIDTIERLRLENLEMLKELGKLQSAETTTFKGFIERIERNNLEINKNLGIIQAFIHIEK